MNQTVYIQLAEADRLINRALDLANIHYQKDPKFLELIKDIQEYKSR